jgi:hypothetical protein
VQIPGKFPNLRIDFPFSILYNLQGFRNLTQSVTEIKQREVFTMLQNFLAWYNGLTDGLIGSLALFVVGVRCC